MEVVKVHSIEVVMKRCSFAPIRVAGEIVFGTWGETWEQKRLDELSINNQIQQRS